MELLNNEGFLQRFFKPETNEIVAIRSGKITNHGTIQEILVLDSSGNFYLYNYNLFSATASPYVDKKNHSDNLSGLNLMHTQDLISLLHF